MEETMISQGKLRSMIIHLIEQKKLPVNVDRNMEALLQLVDSGIINITKSNWAYTKAFDSKLETRREIWLEMHKPGIIGILSYVLSKNYTQELVMDELVTCFNNIIIEMEQEIIFTEATMPKVPQGVKNLLKKLAEHKIRTFLSNPHRLEKIVPNLAKMLNMIRNDRRRLGRLAN